MVLLNVLHCKTYGTCNGENRLRDQRNVLQVPQIGGLEQINVGHTVFDASLLKPKKMTTNTLISDWVLGVE